jgi:hypothetical protein
VKLPRRVNRELQEKRCGKCGRTKPISEFHRDRRNSTGFYTWCKECTKSKYADNRISIRKRVQGRRADPKFREREYAYNRTLYRDNFNNYRESRLRSSYGINMATYDTMLDRQGGVCAICRRPGKRRLCVDHCHTSKAVRGILCANCNAVLGMAKDSIDVLKSAITYLRKSK